MTQPGSERLRREEQELKPKVSPSLQQYIEEQRGVSWVDFKEKMKPSGVNPAFFAMSPIDQLDESFFDLVKLALQKNAAVGNNPYQAALETAARADERRDSEINGDASSRIDAASASLRETTAKLMAERKQRDKGSSIHPKL